MNLRAVGIFVCLSMALPVESGDILPLKEFHKYTGNDRLLYFTPQQMNEASWAKPDVKANIHQGSTTDTQIVDVNFKLGSVNNQHNRRLCTLDCRDTDYEITGYSIVSVGNHGGTSIVFTYDTEKSKFDKKQLTFSIQSLDKSEGCQLKIDVWGKLKGNKRSSAVPVAECIDPRN